MILFPENRSRLGSNLFTSVNEISLSVSSETLREFKSKECLSKCCVLHQEVHHLLPW